MKKIAIYMHRMLLTNQRNFQLSILFSTVTFLIIAFFSRNQVCETYESTRSLIFAYAIGGIFTGLFTTVCLHSGAVQHLMPMLKLRILISVGQYIAAIIGLQVVISAAQAVIATVILSFFDYGREGIIFGENGAGMEILVTMFLTILAASALGLAVSFLVTRIETAMTVVPIILISQIMLSKAIFSIDDKYDFICNFIEARWTFSAIGSIFDCNQFPLSVRLQYPQIGQPVNDLFEHTMENLVNCWMHLGLLCALFIAIGYAILAVKVYKKE